MYESDVIDPINPLAIAYDDSAQIVDTVTFQKVLGPGVTVISVDTNVSRLDLRRFIIRFKESEICVYHYSTGYVQASHYRMEVHSALINNKEIVLKNGLHVGMTKKECLEKYPVVQEPSDVVYISEGEEGYLRLEFKNNLLEHLEFWGNDNVMSDFGGLGVFTISEPYNPIAGPIDSGYFNRLLGAETIQEIDTIEITAEDQQGYPKKVYQYHYFITHENSQFELQDFNGAGTHLSLLSAYISSPLVELTDNVKVGMPREKFLNRFELPSDLKVAWINTPAGRLRFVLDENQVTSIEIGSGRIGRN
jgi:hypothetical protein